jgi:sulfite reductase alpha subunit-like flavoprotein
MAKDVDATLVAIAQQHGKLSEEAAAEYTRALAAEERYVRDVY